MPFLKDRLLLRIIRCTTLYSFIFAGSSFANDAMLVSNEKPETLLEEDTSPVEIEDEPSWISTFLKGYKITVGPTVKELSFDYERDGGEEGDGPDGSMTGGMYTTYFIRTGSPYTLNSTKKWGYYYEWEYSDFSMTKQNVDGKEKDLGTSVEGKYWYLMPILFGLIGPVPGDQNEFSFIGGVGLGIGYIRADGEMILTEDGSNERIKVDKEGLCASANLLIEAHYGKWMSRIRCGGPILGGDLGAYTVFEFVWDFGYTFSF